MRLRPALLAAALLLAIVPALTAMPSAGQGVPEGSAVVTNAVQVVTGDQHACARLGNGQALCWGENGASRLGHSGIIDQDQAGLVQGVGGAGQLSGIAQLAAGGAHTCARLNNGQMRCWGENQDRQLGTGNQNDGGPFVVLNRAGTGPLTGVRQIAAGADHTCAIVTGGQVRCFGDNVNGELGDGTTQVRNRLVIVRAESGVAPLSGATQITAGTDFTCVRLNTGQARCWGNNTSGQFGRGDVLSRSRPAIVRNATDTAPLTGVVSISAGANSTCTRMTDDSARCFGNGFDGRLGNGDDENEELPVRVRAVSGPGFLAGVRNLEVGSGHVCAAVNGNQIRCWGSGDDDALGNGPTADSFVPVITRNVADTGPLLGATQASAGQGFSCARLNNGQVRCWGDDTSGRLGNGFDGSSATPVIVFRSS